MFSDYLERWTLTPDGDPIITQSSRLLPVRCGGVLAMLKVAMNAEERRGGARVLAHDGNALLLERAVAGISLANFARAGRDDEASRIICAAVAALHAPRSLPPPDLVSL